MKLLQIPPDVTDQVWAAVEPYLVRAVSYSRGTHSVENAKARSKSGAAQLWVVIEDEKPHKIVAAGLTSVNDYPTGKRALMIELLGGDSMQTWFNFKTDLEKFGAANGCHLCFFLASKGWVRHLKDYQISHLILHKELAA